MGIHAHGLGNSKQRISSHVPTADVVVESSHHVIGQILHMMLHGTMVRAKAELEAAFDNVCV